MHSAIDLSKDQEIYPAAQQLRAAKLARRLIEIKYFHFRQQHGRGPGSPFQKGRLART